MMMTYLVEGDE